LDLDLNQYSISKRISISWGNCRTENPTFELTSSPTLDEW
jgi:hypothetical protein